ncbi:MAG TPA: alkaline phosphatase family protein [Terriglobales bacterium]
MKKNISRVLVLVLLAVILPISALASAYNQKPKVVVIIIVDQLRGDLVERYHDEFVSGGFRRFTDQGAWFTTCYYQYANTRTAPGHATLGTGTYSLGHGIINNEWFDPKRNHMVSSVDDDNTVAVGADVKGISASPFNLLTDTIGDELKLGTSGRARVFGIALKDRAAILPVGYSANAAFWIDHDSGQWITSSYYMKQAPTWLLEYNQNGTRAKAMLGKSWKGANGEEVFTTTPQTKADGTVAGFYDTVGATPYANDYTIAFAEELMERENVGSGPVTDLVSVSFSSHDILGHRKGPDSNEEHEMMLALDKQLAGFFSWLDQKYGRDNVVLAFAADHGMAPVPAFAAKMRVPAVAYNGREIAAELNRMIDQQFKSTKPAATSAKQGKLETPKYVIALDYPLAMLDEHAWEGTKLNEADAEKMVGELLMKLGLRGYVTKSQLAKAEVPDTVFTRKYLNSYSPHGSWYVMGMARPFVIGYPTGTDHEMPYTYDSHIPLAFAGPMFRPGQYRETVEPVDLAVTLSSVLGVNPPASAVGRVLHEAFADAPAPGAPSKGVAQ